MIYGKLGGYRLLENCYMYRRKFRSQTSDNMDRWKVEMGRVTEERRSEKRKSQKKEDADARNGRKVAFHCVCPMICGSGGSKSRLAKAAGAEPCGQMRDEKLHAVVASKSKCTKHTSSGLLLAVEMSKKCMPLWREAHFEVKMYKTHQLRTTVGRLDVEKVHAVVVWSAFPSQNAQNTRGTTFGGRDIEKVHAVVARSTFRNQNVQSTGGAGHFWQLTCRKSARRCGAKHIFQVKMQKIQGIRITFGGWDVEKVHAVVARRTFRSQNVQNNSKHKGSDHFWRLRCRTSARRCGAKHISKWKCSKRKGFGSLLEVQMSLRFTTLHYMTLHYAPLHYTTGHLHYTTLQYTPLHFTTLHHTTLHHTTLHYATLHYITLHYTTLHCTPLHYITLYYTIFHYTSLPYTTLRSITLPLQLQLHN